MRRDRRGGPLKERGRIEEKGTERDERGGTAEGRGLGGRRRVLKSADHSDAMLFGLLSALLLLGPWIAGPGPGLGPKSTAGPESGLRSRSGIGLGWKEPGRAHDSWAQGSASSAGAGEANLDQTSTGASGLPQAQTSGQTTQELGMRGPAMRGQEYSIWENSFWSPSTWWDQIEQFEEGLGKSVAALTLVAVSMVLASINHLGISKDMAVSVSRAFLQLAIIGFILNFIFMQEGWRGLLMIFAVYCFMVIVAGYTAGQRAKGIPNAAYISCTAIFLGSGVSIAMLVALQVFDFTPRYLIPVAGMMVGNAMNNTSVALKRLREDLRQTVPLVEAALALGATPRQAIQQQIKRSLTLALTPVLDSAKTLGIISLPGAMTGMIMGGASPLEATKLQMVVATFLIGCSTLSCMFAVFMAWPCFFTPAYQIVDEYLEAS